MDVGGEARSRARCGARCGRALAAPRGAVLLALALLHGWPTAARASSAAPVSLEEGWELRWEDPARAEAPADGAGAAGWAAGRLPAVASGWPGRRTLWLRRALPAQRLRDPVLLARAVDQTLEVWVDGERIYALGDLEARPEVFATADWSHLVSLPEDFGGKELVIRIRSDYARAGVGEIRIGPRDALVRELLAHDVARVVFGLLALFSAVLEALIFLRRPAERLHLAFGVFALAIGGFLLAQSAPAQLLAAAPALCTRVAFASLYTTPIGALAFVEELFGPGPASPLRRARQACTAYAVLALSLAGLGVVSLTRTLSPFLVLLAASAAVTAALTLRAAVAGSRDGRLLLFGMTALLAAAANDILVSLGVVTWLTRLVGPATFLFLLSLGAIAANRLAEIHTRAACDSLTGLLNHGAFAAHVEELLASRRAGEFPLSVVMIDVDHFKRTNDEFGHPMGDEVLRRVGAALREVVRDGDVAARYGGEEFALLLPRCPPAAARRAAERLRAAIAAIRVAAAPALRITASFGISSAPEPRGGVDARTMIAQADEALYAAKAAGRDRVCLFAGERALS